MLPSWSGFWFEVGQVQQPVFLDPFLSPLWKKDQGLSPLSVQDQIFLQELFALKSEHAEFLY